ncbi:MULTISPECIES: hypothetical protein [Paenibacillus]|uniref:hypothetical protein n=1 Tax=Paenibacillus TaxID=44249 RepID=UPI00300AE89B
MNKFEYGQLSKRIDRIGYMWTFYLIGSERGFDDNLEFLDVLNILGQEGWELAIKESSNNDTGEREYILYRELSGNE